MTGRRPKPGTNTQPCAPTDEGWLLGRPRAYTPGVWAFSGREAAARAAAKVAIRVSRFLIVHPLASWMILPPFGWPAKILGESAHCGVGPYFAPTPLPELLHQGDGFLSGEDRRGKELFRIHGGEALAGEAGGELLVDDVLEGVGAEQEHPLVPDRALRGAGAHRLEDFGFRGQDFFARRHGCCVIVYWLSGTNGGETELREVRRPGESAARPEHRGPVVLRRLLGRARENHAGAGSRAL